MLPTWYNDYRLKIEENIKKLLENIFLESHWEVWENFKEMIFYATAWGKRFRSILALETYLCLSWKKLSDLDDTDDIWKICTWIEIIHSFSLVHDDLPCMDNDELRRGKLTVWKKYGEYQAVLVWDLLNTLAFEILSLIQDAEISRKMVRLLSNSIGFYGMIGGQVEDMYYEENKNLLDMEKLVLLHNKKTWKLIQASLVAGSILAKKENFIKGLEEFWKNIGLAFQVKDDILDVEGTKEETGKSVGGEEKWFVALVWIEKSKKILSDLQEKCIKEAESFWSEKIVFMTNYIFERKG